jgi:hypothetical protein
MIKAEATPVVQSIVTEFINNGLVESADRQVQNGGLYPLLN